MIEFRSEETRYKPEGRESISPNGKGEVIRSRELPIQTVLRKAFREPLLSWDAVHRGKCGLSLGHIRVARNAIQFVLSTTRPEIPGPY